MYQTGFFIVKMSLTPLVFVVPSVSIVSQSKVLNCATAIVDTTHQSRKRIVRFQNNVVHVNRRVILMMTAVVIWSVLLQLLDLVVIQVAVVVAVVEEDDDDDEEGAVVVAEQALQLFPL